jgi:hypothetical protein
MKMPGWVADGAEHPRIAVVPIAVGEAKIAFSSAFCQAWRWKNR